MFKINLKNCGNVRLSCNTCRLWILLNSLSTPKQYMKYLESYFPFTDISLPISDSVHRGRKRQRAEVPRHPVPRHRGRVDTNRWVLGRKVGGKASGWHLSGLFMSK